jgi:hypothetical protein
MYINKAKIAEDLFIEVLECVKKVTNRIGINNLLPLFSL